MDALKMSETSEPLTMEQLREVPHGKIKDSTLQSIYDRANKIAAAKSDLERAKIQAFVVTEYCPHCEKEQSILWDAGKDGYESTARLAVKKSCCAACVTNLIPAIGEKIADAKAEEGMKRWHIASIG